MPSSYPGQHMPLPRLEPGTSEMRWVSVANWATPVVCYLLCFLFVVISCVFSLLSIGFLI
ncbi:hypothetical protein Hanom_Chr03g00213981 [Helianthus anomalus]